MRFHYISPSILPSRSANSVHVAWQSHALSEAGAAVTLYAKRSVPDAAALPHALGSAYGIDASALELVTFFSRNRRADNARIAAMALGRLLRAPRSEAVLSRNLYAAFALGVQRRRPIIFETHQLEPGVRKRMQQAVMTRPWVVTVVISDSLVRHLTAHHGVAPHRPIVLRDAAPDGMLPVPEDERRSRLRTLVPDAYGPQRAVCGYFGQLFEGRGVDIVERMAAMRPEVLFLIFGGDDRDAAERQRANRLSNLRYLGHVPHPVSRQVMGCVDVLLMPYQRQVSLGVAYHDTSGWMSPMKMFEYMASGVPLIASDLPALTEVLRDRDNCLLAMPDSADAWVAALDALTSDSALARRLAACAHDEYRREHTWSRRARALLGLAQTLS